MRALIITFVGGLAFAASAQAAPLSPRPAAIEVGAASSVQPVGRGWGCRWHRRHWQDHWGNWHWTIVSIRSLLSPSRQVCAAGSYAG